MNADKKTQPINLAIVGSRHYTDYEYFQARVDRWIAANGRPDRIISGGAAGTDKLAERFAAERNIDIVVFRADWSLGKSAGPKRNAQIVDACTHVLAFPSRTGKGTQDTIRKATAANRRLEHEFVD